MSWTLIYTLASEIGLFATITSLPSIYCNLKYIIYGSDTYRLEKKMEKIINQNNVLKIELKKIKADNILHDKELKKLDYDVVTIYDILDIEEKGKGFSKN